MNPGWDNRDIAEKLGISARKAGRWRKRFAKSGLAGLADRVRPGRPRVFSHDDVLKVVVAACNPPDGRTHWTVRDLAGSLEAELGMSRSRLHEVMRVLDLKPHRHRMWLNSRDPDFEAKEADIVGLYLNPPENALVVCVDEKTAIQALGRTRPSKGMRPGSPEKVEFEYVRHGTQSPFAALLVHEGQRNRLRSARDIFLEEHPLPQWNSPEGSLPKLEFGMLFGLAILKLAIHLYTNAFAGFGIFRDELYYLACARHLDFGYVDHPPLSILILALNTWLFGKGLFALRLLPALAGAANVFLVGMLARELGGGRFAQSVAALTVLVSLIHLAFGAIFSMNAFDLLIWTAAVLLLVRLIRTGNSRLWLAAGALLGLGLLNKTSVLWLGTGLGAALLLTPQRSWLKTRWPWIAGGIALLIFSPYILWNLSHDLAHLEFIRNASAGKYSGLSPWTFLGGLFLVNNPVTLPVWLGGIVYLLWSGREKSHRFAGIIFVAVALILTINGHSKSDYLAAACAIPFAGGGVAFERLLSTGFLPRLRPLLVVLLLSGLGLAPVVLPILPVEGYLAYAETLGVRPSTAENLELAELPQFYADMFGWQNMAATVASVYSQLSDEERADCVALGLNYGEAGALEYYSDRYDLPPVIGRHNNYWIWGWGDTPRPTVVLITGGRPEDHRARCGEVVQKAVIRSPYAMPYENNLPVFVCRDLNATLPEIWPQIKVYH